MTKIQPLLFLIFLLIMTSCAGPGPTPAATPVVVVLTHTTAPTAAVIPTSTLTVSPSPTLIPTSRWQCDPSGGLACFQDLYYITMLSAEEGWAVSVPRYGKQLVLHYTTVPGEPAPSWRQVPSDTFEPPKGYLTPTKFMLSDTEGWLVGDKGRIAHFIDGQWQDVPSPTDERLLDVIMLNAEEGWAVGGGTLLHYLDGRWEQVPIADFYGDLNDIEMVSDTEGWIVGGTILRYQDGIWQEVPNSISPGWLTAVSMVNADEGWAVHNWGRIFHYIGGE